MGLSRKAADEFVRYWAGRGDEKGETQQYWIDLLQNVLGDEDALRHLRFEARIDTEAGQSKGFADVTVLRPDGRGALALIEQKSAGVDLDKPEPRQGRMVTPVQQCRAYAEAMPLNEQPRWVLTCNFKTIRAYDRNADPLCSKAPAFELALTDLPRNLDALSFLVGGAGAPVLAHEVSVQAGILMGRVHDMLAESFSQVMDPDAPEVHHALSVICTRLMFLMFCEDAGLIDANAFRDFLRDTRAEHLRRALAGLFAWLDTPDAERDPFDVKDGPYRRFPYMNGGLFAERVQIPTIDETLRTLLIVHGCQEFDWSAVSPTVFGSIFEGALSHDGRRAGGMHYTSPENIHKLIDPLFLDGLKAELAAALDMPAGTGRTRALGRLHDKLGALSFLDPACGSGNFLTETYVELRKLENRILAAMSHDTSLSFAFEDVEDSPVKVSLANFRGIEINDFACCVARTALWIAEKQADMDTAKVVRRVYDELPLTDYGCITQGNALRLDWNDVLPAQKCSYVIGNPPFIGYSNLTEEQKEDRAAIFGKDGGVLDYVACWYKKAADYMRGTSARCAFVSTNSICQGQQVAPLWRPLFEDGLHIDFAHRTFVWNSEATDEAHVHVVILGFSRTEHKGPCLLFDAGRCRQVPHINAYLAPAADAFVEKHSKPLCDVPEMSAGGKPTDGGFLLLTQDERDELLAREPGAAAFVRPFSMGAEFINAVPRYCLWLEGVAPASLKAYPEVLERVRHVREFRQASKKEATRKKAATPWLFDEVRPPVPGPYIAVPKVSSGRRTYVPIGFVTDGMIPGDMLFFISGAGLYEFGVLTSRAHNAWMRQVAGRLKSDYRYTNTIVYNNFVWPEASAAQRTRIEACAQAVLDARAAHPHDSLADMYEPANDWLYPDLMAAHKALDAAVEAAYGVDFGGDEERIVAHLFDLYAQKTRV